MYCSYPLKLESATKNSYCKAHTGNFLCVVLTSAFIIGTNVQPKIAESWLPDALAFTASEMRLSRMRGKVSLSWIREESTWESSDSYKGYVCWVDALVCDTLLFPCHHSWKQLSQQPPPSIQYSLQRWQRLSQIVHLSHCVLQKLFEDTVFFLQAFVTGDGLLAFFLKSFHLGLASSSISDNCNSVGAPTMATSLHRFSSKRSKWIDYVHRSNID